MVNSFIADSFEKCISCTTLSISKGDTIIFKFDQDIFDMQEVSGIIKTYQQVFPNNKIVGLDKIVSDNNLLSTYLTIGQQLIIK